jgi:hypothetical protein
MQYSPQYQLKIALVDALTSWAIKTKTVAITKPIYNIDDDLSDIDTLMIMGRK